MNDYFVNRSPFKELNRIEIVENGPWRAGNNRQEYFVESDDFTHDVRLYINGDFETHSQKMAYAYEIARRLNEWEKLQNK